ncbi:MAG: hypothetical protein GWQ05_29435 [Verrucomicrobiaceae bacterium]|nr:hypothetical protein [Verrucomicrobiaceae bacterium]
MSTVHVTWFLIAVTAFVVGFRRTPSQGERVDLDERSQSSASSTLLVRSSANSETEIELSSEASHGTTLTEQDIRALGEKLRQSPNPIDKRLAFSKLLEGLTKENALLVREQIARLDHRSAEFREFHYAWGALAGAEAAMFGAETKEDDMSPALAGWANANPSEALAWFENLDLENDAAFQSLLEERKLKPEVLRNHLMRGLVQGLASADPDKAIAYVIGQTEAGNKAAYGMIDTVAESVLRTDKPAQAAQWTDSLPEGHVRNMAMRRVAERYVDDDPQAAAEWAAQYADLPGNAGVIAEVGENWASRDPKSALEWLTSLPEGRGQQVGMHQAVREWTDEDPAAASEYLTSMPTSAARDAAIMGFTNRLAYEDPESAIAWAETVSTNEGRMAALATIGRNWARKDPQAAAEWAASSGLPEKVQQSIINPESRRRDRDQ